MGLFEIFFPLTVIIPFVGFPANVFILWFLIRKPGLCSTSDIFTANLAILDALCSLLQPLEVIMAIFSPRNQSILQSVLLNQFAGPLFQTCTCMDCYIGVRYPITFLKFKEPRFRLVMCAVIWATMLIFYFVSNYASGNSSETKMLECIAGFLIGELFIMFYCNIRILHALMQRGPGCQQVHPAKLRAYRTLLTLLIMVMVHYVTPSVSFLMISYNEVDRISLFTIISYMLACISCCNHPFFYLLRSGKVPWFFCPKI